MIDSSLVYIPDTALPPGLTLAEVLAERDMTQVELAERMGCTKDHVNRVLHGRAPISPQTALQLESVLGVPASFWNNLEKNYQETMTRLARRKQAEKWTGLLADFPYRELVELGLVGKATEAVDRVEQMLRFFGVANPQAIETQYSAAFRLGSGRHPSGLARAAWLRMCERRGSDAGVKPFDPRTLKGQLEGFRDLLRTMPSGFAAALQDRCKDCGITLVYAPHLPKTYVQGATRWMSPDRALVGLSLRGRRADILWFSFFHEIGHILLHAKGGTFIQEEKASAGNVLPMEKEADDFARDLLIHPDDFAHLKAQGPRFSEGLVTGFAQRVGIHPCMVVGRLQREKLVPYNSPLSRLCPSLTWVTRDSGGNE